MTDEQTEKQEGISISMFKKKMKPQSKNALIQMLFNAYYTVETQRQQLEYFKNRVEELTEADVPAEETPEQSNDTSPNSASSQSSSNEL